MAELLNLGKHCELTTCNKLDYTPFFCRTCDRHFCSDHRFVHGCNSSREYDPSEATTSANPLRPYLCSNTGCAGAESIKVVCPYCSLNFCLKHRHAVDHSCAHLPVDDKKERIQQALDQVRSQLVATGSNDPSSISREPSVSNTQPATSAQTKQVAVLSEADQRKADRVAVMKLKMGNRSGLGPNEQLIVFVESEGVARQPVILAKSWTIGRATDSIMKSLSLPTLKMHINDNQLLDPSEPVSKLLKDLQTVHLK